MEPALVEHWHINAVLLSEVGAEVLSRGVEEAVAVHTVDFLEHALPLVMLDRMPVHLVEQGLSNWIIAHRSPQCLYLVASEGGRVAGLVGIG